VADVAAAFEVVGRDDHLDVGMKQLVESLGILTVAHQREQAPQPLDIL
jgi:hypothetical protein